MIGLISTPSTRRGAEHERRHEVAAAARSDHERSERRARFLQLIGERGQLVAEVLDVRQVGRDVQDRRRRGRVDVHEPGVGQRAGVGGTQRPVAVRAARTRRSRERIPLAEEHAIALVPLGVEHVERGDAGQLSGDRNEHEDRRDDDGVRRRRSGDTKSSAAAKASAAAVRTTPGAPRRSSSGMRTRQPAAAPMISAAYTPLIRAARREIASVITSPPVKNGSEAST